MGYRAALRNLEINFWTDLLTQTKGNVKEAAKLAGTTRQNAYKVFARLNFENPARRSLRGNWRGLTD